MQCFFWKAANTANGFCTTGETRLELSNDNETTNTRKGRLELCISNAWGTVCDSLFGAEDAAVACSQLSGFSSQGEVLWHTSVYTCL